ncbi:MAG: hypothetical protein ABIG68_03040 [Acidobacteriota bacterium]
MPRSLGFQAPATALGYVAAAGMYVLTRALRNRVPHFSRGFLISSLVLLFYTTLRLHFFVAEPAIGNRWAAVALLLVVVAFFFVEAVIRRSQALAAMSLVLLLTTALLADQTRLTLSLLNLSGMAAVCLALWKGWYRSLNFAVPAVYLAHLVWLWGNPIAGNPLRVADDPQYSLVHLFGYFAAIFVATLFGEKRCPGLVTRWTGMTLNCLGLTALVGFSVLAFYREDFSGVFLGFAGLVLAASVVQWAQTHHDWIPSVYAAFGYMGLTVAIYGYTGPPEAFLWLALQSLLVVSMSLWFRSRLLVVLNSLIFLGILLAYLAVSPLSDAVNLGFAFVALASARIMNWQKERLTLKTEMLRNVYLAVLFGMMLYALGHALPQNYTALAWTAAAAAYFLLSLLLHNIKYRWMSVLTLLATVLHLIFVDLRHLEPGYRVAAFLFLGVMALTISLFYAKLRSMVSKTETADEENDRTNRSPA